MRPYDLTPAAAADLRDIARHTLRQWGARQQRRYARQLEACWGSHRRLSNLLGPFSTGAGHALPASLPLPRAPHRAETPRHCRSARAYGLAGASGKTTVSVSRIQSAGGRRDEGMNAATESMDLSDRRPTLQEHSSAQPVDIDEQSDVLSAPALQDLSLAQSLVLTGLIAHLTGAALQEDIAITSRRLQQLALDIVQRDPDGRETIALPHPPATHPRAAQLDRPPPGA